MSVKAEKPTLTGARIKTRKRDEKEKYDPAGFRDQLLQGLIEAGDDLDQISIYLDKAGSKLNYHRYADVIFDVLFAGGILAPGGNVVTEGEDDKVVKTSVCVFTSKPDIESLKSFYEVGLISGQDASLCMALWGHRKSCTVFYKLIRRYKYLEKTFEDEIRKLILFLRGFSDDERMILARITGIVLANGLASASVLSNLFEDFLVKNGMSLEFASAMFTTWLSEKDINHVAACLKRAKLEDELMNFFPIHKRTTENFEAYFKEADLDSIVEYQKSKNLSQVKKKVRKLVDTLIEDETPVKEIILTIKEQMKENGLSESEAIVMCWNSVMGSVDWNKKQELVEGQCLKLLKPYTPLFGSLNSSAKSQLGLMLKIQTYCYDNTSFMKVFHKIILLFYKTDVLGEEVILKWYKGAHSAKGKSVFLEQMKKFVEWLENAEEESDEEEDDED